MVVGGCETTSLLGPGLGGGHGFLQGKYELISDQFVPARTIIADGSVQYISAGSVDPDLWWAIQGAGHNFGLLTSISVNIYDIEGHVRAHRTYSFTIDKAKPVYQLVNKFWPDGSTPTHFDQLLCFLVHSNRGCWNDKFTRFGISRLDLLVYIYIWYVKLTQYTFI